MCQAISLKNVACFPALQEFNGDVATLLRLYIPGTRQWLLKSFDAWQSAANPASGSALQRRAWVLSADAGVGKSSFAALLLRLRGSSITAHHFFRREDPEKACPRRALASLAFQLAVNLPGALPVYSALVRDLSAGSPRFLDAAPLEAMFDRLLKQPLARLDALAAGAAAGRLRDGSPEMGAAGTGKPHFASLATDGAGGVPGSSGQPGVQALLLLDGLDEAGSGCDAIQTQ